MADVEADRGGKGKERGIGERRFNTSALPTIDDNEPWLVGSFINALLKKRL